MGYFSIKEFVWFPKNFAIAKRLYNTLTQMVSCKTKEGYEHIANQKYSNQKLKEIIQSAAVLVQQNRSDWIKHLSRVKYNTTCETFTYEEGDLKQGKDGLLEEDDLKVAHRVLECFRRLEDEYDDFVLFLAARNDALIKYILPISSKVTYKTMNSHDVNAIRDIYSFLGYSEGLAEDVKLIY